MHNCGAFVHFYSCCCHECDSQVVVFIILSPYHLSDCFFIHLKLCMFFHQLANVYCPQKILYLIHNVG